MRALQDIMEHLAPQGASYKLGREDFSAFIRYLKENEAQVPKELYTLIFESYIDRAVAENLVQKNLWEQTLTPLQLEILEKHLIKRHPQLLISFKIWRRDVSEGLGQAMKIGHGI